MEKLVLSVQEMAKTLGISRPTAYKLANSPGFPVVLIRGRKTIPVKLLEEWLRSNAGNRH